MSRHIGHDGVWECETQHYPAIRKEEEKETSGPEPRNSLLSFRLGRRTEDDERGQESLFDCKAKGSLVVMSSTWKTAVNICRQTSAD